MDNVMQRMRDLLTRLEAIDTETKARIDVDPRANVNQLVIQRREIIERIKRMADYL